MQSVIDSAPLAVEKQLDRACASDQQAL